MARRYTRVHRLLRILNLIQSGGAWDAKRLSQECRTTERNIYRDLNMLEGAGVPYFHDTESGGYRIHRDFFMPPIELTLEEALAVICLAEHVGAAEQIPFMKPAGRASAKLRSQLPSAIRDRLDELCPHVGMRLASSMPPDGIQDVYELVRQAIATRRQLRCRYESQRTASTMRKPASENDDAFLLKPYCLFFGQRAWYVVGYHGGRREVRNLKLNRFSDIRPTSTPYAIPDDFSLEKHLGKAWRMIRGNRVYRVELEFDATFADNVSETHWHDTQEIEEHADKSITFRCEVAGLDEIVWWVLSMGPHCVVRLPKELADRVRDLASATASQYLTTLGARKTSTRSSGRPTRAKLAVGR